MRDRIYEAMYYCKSHSHNIRAPWVHLWDLLQNVAFRDWCRGKRQSRKSYPGRGQRPATACEDSRGGGRGPVNLNATALPAIFFFLQFPEFGKTQINPCPEKNPLGEGLAMARRLSCTGTPSTWL